MRSPYPVSQLAYLPPRAFCERTFEPCDGWVEAGREGVIEASTIVVRGFEGKRPPPAAIAFVRLDGVDSAIANYVDGVDLSHFDTIVPCGLVGRGVTSLRELLGERTPTMDEVKAELVKQFGMLLTKSASKE